MKKLIDDVEKLIDRESIRQLPIIYCHYVRQKNIDAIVDLFTTDGKLILSDDLGSGAQDSEALRQFYEKSISTADPWPFIHNHHIVMLGDGRAKGYVYAEIRYGSEGFKTTSIGVYEDEYQKEGGGWKFKSRNFESTPVPQ